MVHFSFTPIRRWLVSSTPAAALTTSLTAGLFTAALAANAQTDARVVKPDPLDPNASVPALSYESSFSRYRRLGDEKPVSWREANDTVARIGGWRVYAREAQQADPGPGSKPAESTPVAAPTSVAAPTGKETPMPAGHSGHGGHKTP